MREGSRLNTFVCFEPFIPYFGNFVFGFSSLRLRDFLYYVFHLQGKMVETKWRINKLSHNIMVTLSTKATKNEVTRMGWNAQFFVCLFVCLYVCLNCIVDKGGRKIRDEQRGFLYGWIFFSFFFFCINFLLTISLFASDLDIIPSATKWMAVPHNCSGQ